MHRVEPKLRSVPLLLAAAVVLAAPAARAAWTFTNVTPAAGVNVLHDVDTLGTQTREQLAGVACADYNGDGWPDLYFVGGNNTGAHNYLFRNNGDGTFTDVAAAMGVDDPMTLGAGPCFADWDGDGDPDLFVGGIESTDPKLYRNDGTTFTDVTTASGVVMSQDTYSATFADLNGDDWLDLMVTHWTSGTQSTGHIWINNGDGTFTDSDAVLGYSGFPPGAGGDYTFTYNGCDLDSDGDMDFVCSSDFGTSHVYRNDNGTFHNVTDVNVINDEDGMGCATGDYDNDGDIDWFVTSIYNGAFKTGNRLYENNGSGVFTNVTGTAGVTDGTWGWGATMQDFDNDGFLDIYHVDGWRNGYPNSPSRLFRNNGDKTFTDLASTVNANDAGEGRGVVAFDYDRDGDLDLFIANNDQQARLLRNDGLTNHWLTVTLTGPSPNVAQIGARVKVTVGATTQMREIRCGNNFESQDPSDAHFGLGTSTVVNTLRIEWTDGNVTTFNNLSADQFVHVIEPATDAPNVGSPAPDAIKLLAAAPNPFRTGTVFRFSLNRPAETTVKVYDAAGRIVRSLSAGTLGAGHQIVAWDGRDDAGRPASSGVYWYVVSTPDQSARGKVTLVR